MCQFRTQIGFGPDYRWCLNAATLKSETATDVLLLGSFTEAFYIKKQQLMNVINFLTTNIYI